MIVLLCGECQMEMYLHDQKYFDESGNRYRIEYILIDENLHLAQIRSNVKEYDPESAEARLIQSLIEHNQRIESAS